MKSIHSVIGQGIFLWFGFEEKKREEKFICRNDCHVCTFNKIKTKYYFSME
jgi:hypothetical protein